MGVFDLFSRRGRSAPDVLQYSDLPQPFRVQVCHLWRAAIAPHRHRRSHYDEETPATSLWRFIHGALCKEYGRFRLADGDDPYDECCNHVLSASVEEALDVVELSFRLIDRLVREDWARYAAYGATQKPDDAIGELNDRFAQHGIGFRYEAGVVVRVDSTFLHAEVVKPALVVFAGRGFESADEEFRRAHEHYRHGRHEEAIHCAGSAFESVMKVICDKKNWKYEPDKDTAHRLIDALVREGAVPGWMKDGLLALPRLRNRAGHGAGSKPEKLPAAIEGALAAHALHLAAANAVLLAEAVNW